MGFLNKKSITTYTAAFFAGVLLFSFGLHSIQVKHVHPGVHHVGGLLALHQSSLASEGMDSVHAGTAHESSDVSTIAEYMHGSEKKSFLYVLFALIIAGAYICLYIQHHAKVLSLLVTHFQRYSGISRSLSPRLFSIFRYLLSTGILHPKIYSV